MPVPPPPALRGQPRLRGGGHYRPGLAPLPGFPAKCRACNAALVLRWWPGCAAGLWGEQAVVGTCPDRLLMPVAVPELVSPWTSWASPSLASWVRQLLYVFRLSSTGPQVSEACLAKPSFTPLPQILPSFRNHSPSLFATAIGIKPLTHTVKFKRKMFSFATVSV